MRRGPIPGTGVGLRWIEALRDGRRYGIVEVWRGGPRGDGRLYELVDNTGIAVPGAPRAPTFDAYRKWAIATPDHDCDNAPPDDDRSRRGILLDGPIPGTSTGQHWFEACRDGRRYGVVEIWRGGPDGSTRLYEIVDAGGDPVPGGPRIVQSIRRWAAVQHDPAECPLCDRKHRFQNLPHRVYVVEFEHLEVFKVGITHCLNDHRLNQHQRQGGRVVQCIQLQDWHTARRLERAVLEATAAHRARLSEAEFPQAGWTECWESGAIVVDLAAIARRRRLR
ncbi:hypothetical protein CCO04_27410 [Pimelobacter sp. 30-1]|nr:hypothetical protein [Pimelobacter sp. 30-1]